jgi:hypothetical protein
MTEPIYYTLFSENAVFEDPQINVFFNQLFTFLINNLGEDFITEKLAIDKHIGLLLQDESITVQIPGIFLVTAEKSIFDLIKNSVTALAITDYKIGTDQISVKANATQIFFSLVKVLELTTDYSGIKLIDKTKIVL